MSNSLRTSEDYELVPIYGYEVWRGYKKLYWH
jgi:hypothetical protein